MTELAPSLTVNVPPDEMVKYIQDLMTLPHGEIAAGTAMALAGSNVRIASHLHHSSGSVVNSNG